jgi:hypothetical protein
MEGEEDPERTKIVTTLAGTIAAYGLTYEAG